jgi:predicted metal-dependent hydrolase
MINSITEVEKVTVHYIEAVVDYRTTSLRRNGPNSWERLYGESWEGIWDDEPYEKAYQEFMAR